MHNERRPPEGQKNIFRRSSPEELLRKIAKETEESQDSRHLRERAGVHKRQRPGNTSFSPSPSASAGQGFPERKTCAVASTCQSCTSINFPYANQIALKQADFKKLLSESKINPRVRVGSFEESSPRLNYRQTVKLAVASKSSFDKKWINVGLYRPGTHEVFDIGFCAAQDKGLNELVQTVKYALKEAGVSIHEQRLESKMGVTKAEVLNQGIRYLVARKSYFNDSLMLTFVTSAPQLSKLRIVARLLKQRHPNLLGVLMHVNTSAGNEIFHLAVGQDTPAMELILGEGVAPDSIAGLAVEVHPMAFFQVNPPVAERMYRRIWELAQCAPLEIWLDLYCGIGLIGLGAAQRKATVIGIEESLEAIGQARKNSLLNGIASWTGLAGRAEDLFSQDVPSAELRAAMGSRPTGVVTLNPSRRGCQPSLLRSVAALNPHTIVYMSCNQKTLFRDLADLEMLGYSTRLMENFDMFPGTTHYETLAVLKKIHSM